MEGLISRETGPVRTFQIAQRWATHYKGGSERVVDELATYLPQAGIGFTGFVTGPVTLAQSSGGVFRSFAAEDAGTLTRLRGARSVIGQAIRQERPDVVASHFALYAWPVLGALHATRHVAHFHGPWAAECIQEGGSRWATPFKKGLERKVYRSAARIIVLSRAFQEIAIRDYGIPPDRIRVIPGSVNISRFAIPHSRREARSLLGWPSERPTLITVRRLVNRMGLSNLILAMQAIRQQVPKAILMIGGQGPLRSALEEQVRQAGLQDHVQFLGFVSDEQLPLAYRAADINVVPTIELEGFGLVAAEAMAAGTPSMVTPVGGLPEVVSGLSADLIFRSSSVNDIAGQLIGALSGTSTGAIALPRDEVCRSYIAAHFNSALMAQRTAEVYREALSGSF
jgi:glycosyltransferase involved in cell wall biosynthesis